MPLFEASGASVWIKTTVVSPKPLERHSFEGAWFPRDLCDAVQGVARQVAADFWAHSDVGLVVVRIVRGDKEQEKQLKVQLRIKWSYNSSR